MIKLMKNHFAALLYLDNDLMTSLAFPDPEYIWSSFQNGYIPPQDFIILDQLGLIEDKVSKIPIFYHIIRARSNKTVLFCREDISCNNANGRITLKFNMAISKKDRSDQYAINNERY